MHKKKALLHKLAALCNGEWNAFEHARLNKFAQNSHSQLWPYTQEYTGTRSISEVKLVLARLVLGWETTWE